MNNTDAESVLRKYRDIVWTEIEPYLRDPVFPKQFVIPKKYSALIDYHWKIVSDYPKRKGKYLRPTLLVLTSEAMGIDKSKTLKTAAAMQISEEWILGHDDIQDNSPKRRGKPSLHKIYGVELAINAGDTLHALMWKALSDNRELLGEDKTFEIMEEFYKIVTRTTLGQTIDIKWFLENKPKISKGEYFLVADTKSSYYSIAAPIRLGAIIANANENQLDKLADFGVKLGRSFQLIDDVLDVTSNFDGLKQRGNDIYEGKRTLLLGHLLKNASKNDCKKVLKVMSKKRADITPAEVDWVIKKMEHHESIEYVRGMAEQYKKAALEVFEKDLGFLKDKNSRENIEKIVHFVTERSH